MRQLDLFGSLFDTAPQENKPAEKKVVPKKEEETSLVAEAVTPSYSKNALRSERAVANVTVKDTFPEDSIGNQEPGAVNNIPSPALLSLFDTTGVPKQMEA